MSKAHAPPRSGRPRHAAAASNPSYRARAPLARADDVHSSGTGRDTPMSEVRDVRAPSAPIAISTVPVSAMRRELRFLPQSPEPSEPSDSAEPSQSSLSEDQRWAERTHALAGKWVRTRRRSRERIPVREGAYGWGDTWVEAGTVLWVAGVNEADGAIMVNLPRTGAEQGAPEQIWLDHFVVETTARPRPSQESQEFAPPSREPEGDIDTQTRERTEAARDLGDIDALDSGFYDTAGALLETLLPREGDKAKLQLNLNLRVNPSVKIAFQLITEGEHNEDGYKAKVEVGAGVIASVDLWLAEAFAKAMVFGYLEAQGDTGAEVFRLLSYALYDRVASVSADAADYVWGTTFGASTHRAIDEDDYVESGLGVELEVGADAGDGTDASLGARRSRGTRISERGEETIDITSGKLALTVSPWSGEVTFKNTRLGETSSGEIVISGQRAVDLLSFSSALESGAIRELMQSWVTALVSNTQGLIRGTSGLDGSTAQRIGSVLRLAGEQSLGAHIGTTAGLQAASERLPQLNDAAKIGQKLSIKIAWGPSGTTLQIDLERLSSIEVGDNPRDTVYVLVENLARIIDIGPIQLD